MKNFRAGTVSGVSQDEIVKNILVEGKHPSILILRHLRQNSIFFDGRCNGTVSVVSNAGRSRGEIALFSAVSLQLFLASVPFPAQTAPRAS
jgi:hypothetical protein